MSRQELRQDLFEEIRKIVFEGSRAYEINGHKVKEYVEDLARVVIRWNQFLIQLYLPGGLLGADLF